MARGLSITEYCGPGVPGPYNVSPQARKLIAGLIVMAAAGFGHHGTDAFYDLKQDFRIEGQIVQVLIRSPHSFVQVDVRNAEGVNERWAFEWDSAGALVKQGLEKGTLHIGDRVVITAHPWRPTIADPRLKNISTQRGFIKALERPSDGLKISPRSKQSKNRKSPAAPADPSSFGV